MSPEDAVDPFGPILNHEGARLPSIWNLNSIDLPNPNLGIIIADGFGNGQAKEIGGAVKGILNPSGDYPGIRHGYHVLGILAAHFAKSSITDVGG